MRTKYERIERLYAYYRREVANGQPMSDADVFEWAIREGLTPIPHSRSPVADVVEWNDRFVEVTGAYPE